MLNRFSLKQSHSKNNNNTNLYHVNPFRVKRTYNTMLEQSQNIQNIPVSPTFTSKRLKQGDSKPPESLIKSGKPKIPEKLLKEIERYNYQRYGYYNLKVSSCPCEE